MAGELEKPDPHWCWNEDQQRFLPLGQQVAIDRVELEAQPEWRLQQYARTRLALQRFVADQLHEAKYDRAGAPLEGQLQDFYRVPGSKKKALTKLGAEKLASLLRLRRGQSRVTQSVATADYCDARVNCELLDSFGHPAGAHEAAASTAELGFQSAGARRKYGARGEWMEDQGSGHRQWREQAPPDYRAALNDVVARAGKRAFVGAVIVAAAADEIFEIGADLVDGARDETHAGKPPQSRPAESRRRADTAQQAQGGRRVVTPKQRRFLFARARELQLDHADVKAIVRRVTGADSTKAIPIDRFEEILSELAAVARNAAQDASGAGEGEAR